LLLALLVLVLLIGGGVETGGRRRSRGRVLVAAQLRSDLVAMSVPDNGRHNLVTCEVVGIVIR
jgi:hypothetical protein